MSGTDQDLLMRWVNRHDAEAFREIAARHSAMVYATCQRILGNDADAEDAAQECFEVLALKGRKAGKYLGAWLHRVATNLSLERLRAEKRRKAREARFAAQKVLTTEPQWGDIYGFVDEAVAELPDKLRVPIVLHFFENQTHDEIARAIGTSRQTVTYRIGKGIEVVRKSLKKRGVPVATSALAAMMGAKLAEGVSVPASLTTVLGKLAIAGTAASGVGSAAGGAALGSKLFALGGANIMWKSVSLAVGVVVVALGVSYSIYYRHQRSTAPPAREQETTKADVTDTISGGQGSATASQESALPSGDQPAGISGASDQTEDAKSSGFAFFENLLKAYERSAGAGQKQAAGGELEPFSSKDVPQENGAHYFLLAAELYPEVDRDWLFRKWDELRANGWSDDPALQALFDACRESIDAIRTGLAAGNAVMPEPRGPSEQMPYLKAFRDLARVMAMEAQMQAARGNYVAAFDNYATLLAFANESSYGSSLVSVSVGLAMHELALISLRDAIGWGNAGSQDYRNLIDNMNTLDTGAHPAWESVTEEVRIMTSWLDSELDAGTDFRTMLLEDASGTDMYETLAAMSEEQFELYLRDTLSNYQAFVEYFARPYYEVQSMDMNALIGDNPLSQVEFPSLIGLHARVTRTAADLRGTMIMAGVELYRTESGRYPTSLEHLVPDYLAELPEDPFSGRPFVYNPTESGYLLYTTGADMEDNGGAVNAWDADNADMVIHGD